MENNYCCGSNCGTKIPFNRAFCVWHFSLLPAGTKEQMNVAYKKGEADQAYLDLVQEASRQLENNDQTTHQSSSASGRNNRSDVSGKKSSSTGGGKKSSANSTGKNSATEPDQQSLF